MGGVTHRCDVQISLTHRSVSEENTHGTDHSREFPSFFSEFRVVILSTSDIKGNEAWAGVSAAAVENLVWCSRKWLPESWCTTSPRQTHPHTLYIHSIKKHS